MSALQATHSLEAMEAEVARLAAIWANSGRAWAHGQASPQQRQPTLFERYRAAATGEESFGAWLARTRPQ